MSDSSAPNGTGGINGAGNGSGNGAAGQRGQAMPLMVNAQYVKDFSFENPNAPQTLVAAEAPPAIDVQVDVQVRGLSEGTAEVVLSIRAEATAPGDQGDRTVFIADLAYAGLFSFPALPQEQLRAILLIEAPRLLFPFARQIIAEATQNGGYPGLLLQPIDFVDLYRRQVMAQRAQGETALA
jgi:preprotein translocase subunit SecB